jgi:hypothetical protein
MASSADHVHEEGSDRLGGGSGALLVFRMNLELADIGGFFLVESQ